MESNASDWDRNGRAPGIDSNEIISRRVLYYTMRVNALPKKQPAGYRKHEDEQATLSNDTRSIGSGAPALRRLRHSSRPKTLGRVVVSAYGYWNDRNSVLD
jgi:hypothetical protein